MIATGTTASVAEALELLTRRWNPPHRPPRPLRLASDAPALRVPAGTPLAGLAGAYLRGLAFDGHEAERDCRWADLRGCVLGGGAPPLNDSRFSLHERLRGRVSESLLPRLQARLRDPAEGHHDAIHALAVSRRGDRIASGGFDGTLRLWMVAADGSARETMRQPAHPGGTRAIAFGRRSSEIASAGEDGTMRRWALRADGTAEPIATVPIGDSFESGTPGRGIAYIGEEDDHLVCLAADGSLTFWDLNRNSASVPEVLGSRTGRPANPAGGNALAVSRDGRWLAVAHEDGTLALWRPQSSVWQEPLRARSDRNALRAVALLDDGSRVVAGGTGGALTWWATDRDDLSRIATATPINASIDALAVAQSPPRVASGGADGIVRLWSAASDSSLSPIAELAGHEAGITALAFASDDSLLVSADAKGSLRLWALLPDGPARETARIPGRPDPGSGPRLEIDADEARWTLRRSDGHAFEIETANGQPVNADPLLHEALDFWDPSWGCVPVFDAPPEWLRWSSDRRQVTVARAPHEPQELLAWAQRTQA